MSEELTISEPPKGFGISIDDLSLLNDVSVKAGGTAVKKHPQSEEAAAFGAKVVSTREPSGDDDPSPLPDGGATQEDLALKKASMKDQMHQLIAHYGGIAGIGAKLGVDNLAHGVASATVDLHREVFGPNRYKSIPPANFFVLLYRVLNDPMLLLLCAAALISTVLGAAIEKERKKGVWAEGVAIWVAVIIVSLVGAINDWSKDRQFRKLNSEREVFDVNVIRDGEECIVKNVDIVVGDILKLEAGNAVVADGFFVSGFKLKANESSVTGESEPVLKTPAEPYLISGSYVIEGTGTMLVTAVGESSFYGQTLEDIMGEAAETGLQVKLGYLAAAVGKVGASVAFACFCVLLIIWFAKYPGSYADNATDILEFFLYAVTIVVVAVPEGLPLAVTISLAYSMRKMLADKIFVRVMASCETMGGATAICSDKTGTLTENQMTIVEGMFAGEVYGASSGAPQGSDLHPENAMLFSDNAILNSECFKTHDEATGKAIFAGGNATEQAFLILTDAWGLDYHGVRSQKEVHRKYIFSSATKMSHVVVVMDQGYRMHTKGAWDWVLKACQRMRMPDGSEVEMNGEKVTMVTEQATQMARRGLRCLALCYTDLPSTCSDDDFEEPPLQMGTTVLVALVGIKDPVRKEVPDAVAKCKSAGIKVRMVTGDNALTATYIAQECGIIENPETDLVMDGDEFRELSDDDLDKVIDRLAVLARSKPKDKKRLVSFLMEKRGDIVGVTGDGTNDAPALKEASVGLAMGITGTMVAKAASDIVITDDNFNSIVNAVMWGRNVYDSIRKFIQFQLTINFVALMLAFIAAVAQKGMPLNVMQLLWVNLVMDSMAALALATELPTPALLERKPYGKSALISRRMWKHILVQGLYQFTVLLLLLFLPPLVSEYYKTEKCYMTVDQARDVTFPGSTVTPMAFLSSEAKTEDNLYDQFYSTKYWNGKPYEFPAHASKCNLVWPDDCPATNLVTCKANVKILNHETFELYEERQAKGTNSLVFNSFILMQVFNMINSRKVMDEINVFEGIFRNHTFAIVFVIIVAVQIVVVETPVASFFKVSHLSGAEWGVCIALGVIALPLSYVTRVIANYRMKKYGILPED